MRSLKYVLTVFLLLLPALAHSDDLGLMRLSLIEGEVQVLIKDTTDWTAATINLPLNEGDRLWVPEDGKAEFQIRGGVYTRIAENTALDILTISSDSAQFYLDRGHAYINNRHGGVRTVQIDTPLSSFRSYDNSIMMLDVTEDGVTEVSVLEGYVYAESRAGATRVTAGNTLTIRGESSAELAPISSPDDWERWNMDRDRRLFAWGESSRHLPSELHEYSSDFDDNGRWEYAADYGYVWTPTVVVSTWAPYTVGSWIWVRNHYVWIAYDPWCWAPCHYGRWVFIASYGWCWVPPAAGAVYWGPGYVGWTVTPTYVAWVPLAPGEIYYGYGYYGPWSVNITTINVNTVVVKRTYINAGVRNSVVVVQRDTFGTGRRIPARLKENPFVTVTPRGGNITIVPPPLKPRQPIVLMPPEERERMRQQPPERERKPRELPETRRVTPPLPPTPSIRPERPERPPLPPTVVQPRAERVQPPERVRKTRPEELKNERRLVREREASVFKAQPPENMPVKKQKEPRIIIRKPGHQPGEQSQKSLKGERKEEHQERRMIR